MSVDNNRVGSVCTHITAPMHWTCGQPVLPRQRTKERGREEALRAARFSTVCPPLLLVLIIPVMVRLANVATCSARLIKVHLHAWNHAM